ncbi:YbdD/YjiX family protein [Modestobacter sp. VKM Ac-2986]|uniref:YbdD/YjiX family protein n=1 Tax=Modestobacter sp. VKM Ac-2986 TaxID=3004140 RepID=UPI0022AAEFBF|nr:YbdD/YjiX family protein [Modestobacter sp. VKM Ac-2986]MCZ2828404.1 YbdD/YjiX family protein [Modestobacter sp. VKM Ac-2986]
MTAADVRSAVVRAGRGVRWYLREWSGEARWDDHLRECAAHGHAPLTRREFERRRSDAIERNPVSRCC